MSKETRKWLSENTLIGFTDKRSTAWHYREGDDNHYSGAIPVETVERRLFDWEAEEHPIHVEMDRNSYLHIPGRKAIVRSDNQHVMGIFSEGYQPHQYREWLLSNVAHILDDDLSIGSAGLLKDGAVAWVSVEVPDTLVTPQGVRYRPNLLACTSFDGTIATTYKRVVTNVVCDNTMAAALSERGNDQTFKVKHSAKSLGKLQSAKDALGIVYGISEEFEAEVERLCQQEVPDKAWDRALDEIAKPKAEKGQEPTKRAITLADAKRDELKRLWNHDSRVAPWSGTAFGVWQAVNTYQHHSGQEPSKGRARAERNMLRAVDGRAQQADAEAMNKALAVL